MQVEWKGDTQNMTRTTSGSPDGASARDVVLIPRLERSPGVGNGNLLQYFCLENPMDREAWWATVHGVSMSR